MTLTPRQKLVGALVLAAALPVLAWWSGHSAVAASRVLLAAAGLVGLGAWLLRARAGAHAAAFRTAPRLKVIQRVGLSGRAGLVLVEIDGRPWLVAHGDGFAKLRPVRAPRVVKAAPQVAPVAQQELPS